MQQADKFKSRMHSLAYGEAMAAAARDYKKVQCDFISSLADEKAVEISSFLEGSSLCMSTVPTIKSIMAAGWNGICIQPA